MATFEFRITVDWYTLRETGEIITLDCSNAIALSDHPQSNQGHTHVIVIETVSGKGVGATWNKACKIDFTDNPKIAEIKARYSDKSIYSICGNWVRVA